MALPQCATVTIVLEGSESWTVLVLRSGCLFQSVFALATCCIIALYMYIPVHVLVHLYVCGKKAIKRVSFLEYLEYIVCVIEQKMAVK